jgi:hypothetical protein
MPQATLPAALVFWKANFAIQAAAMSVVFAPATSSRADLTTKNLQIRV